MDNERLQRRLEWYEDNYVEGGRAPLMGTLLLMLFGFALGVGCTLIWANITNYLK